MDGPWQAKTLHRFRNLLGQQQQISVPSLNPSSHPMWRVWYYFTGRQQKHCGGPSPKKLKADSVGFLPVCFILAETNVLALWRTRKKDIIFFKCIFKSDDEDGPSFLPFFLCFFLSWILSFFLSFFLSLFVFYVVLIFLSFFVSCFLLS
jgi:hypothetical protein